MNTICGNGLPFFADTSSSACLLTSTNWLLNMIRALLAALITFYYLRQAFLYQFGYALHESKVSKPEENQSEGFDKATLKILQEEKLNQEKKDA